MAAYPEVPAFPEQHEAHSREQQQVDIPATANVPQGITAPCEATVRRRILDPQPLDLLSVLEILS